MVEVNCVVVDLISGRVYDGVATVSWSPCNTRVTVHAPGVTYSFNESDVGFTVEVL